MIKEADFQPDELKRRISIYEQFVEELKIEAAGCRNIFTEAAEELIDRVLRRVFNTNIHDLSPDQRLEIAFIANDWTRNDKVDIIENDAPLLSDVVWYGLMNLEEDLNGNYEV